MLKGFKSLSLGARRALIVGTIPGGLLFALILAATLEVNIPNTIHDYFVAGPAIYWVCVFIGIWIYQGFKSGN